MEEEGEKRKMRQRLGTGGEEQMEGRRKRSRRLGQGREGCHGDR